jgi:hypothetical protein
MSYADYVNEMARPNRENLSNKNSRIVGVRLQNTDAEQLAGEAISEGVTVSKLIRKRLAAERFNDALKHSVSASGRNATAKARGQRRGK